MAKFAVGLALNRVKRKDSSEVYFIDDELARIGAAIKERRKDYSLTQEQLGDLIGISDRTVREIERGTGRPSARTMVELIKAVGLDITLEG